MNKNIKKILSITLVLAMLAGIFTAMPLTANAMPYTTIPPDGFDTTATYTVSSNTHSERIRDHVHGDLPIGHDTIYNFYVTNVVTDKEYMSFCANKGSSGFVGEYTVGTGVQDLDINTKANIVAALNYISNAYGSLDQWSCDNNGQAIGDTAEVNTKLIAQIVIWRILDDTFTITVNNDAVDAAVSEVMASYTGAEGNIDIVYLVGASYPTDIVTSQPQIVPIFRDDSETPEIQMMKTVNGIRFDLWLKNSGYDAQELLSGITFELLAAPGRSVVGGVLAKYEPTADTGIITFDYDFENGLHKSADNLYAVREKFALGSLAETVFQTPTIYYFEYGKTEIVVDFDYDALYTIINGYGTPGTYVLGYPGLNNVGDIFPISVKNEGTGATYVSFCANSGSTHFAGESGLGCRGYYTEDRTGTELVNYQNFVKAYNYIEDTYNIRVGDLSGSDAVSLKDRALVQAVTWALLGTIDVNSPEFDAIADWKVDKAAVKDVIANYEGYTGLSGTDKIVDVVFMVCENPEHSFITCQPQLVPIYGTRFNNTPRTIPETGKLVVDPKATLVTKTKTIKQFWQREKTPYQTVTQYISQGYSSVTATTQEQLTAKGNAVYFDAKNGNAKFDKGNPLVVTNSNHFTYANLSRADLIDGKIFDLTLVVGNKFDEVGIGTVKMVDGQLVLTFDNAYGKPSFGAVAFDGFLPNVKNGNIHSVGIFNSNNKYVIDIYKLNSFTSTGDKKAANYDKDWDEITKGVTDAKLDDFVYLYVHFGNVQFDRGIEESDIEWKVTKDYELKSEKVVKIDIAKTDIDVTFEVTNEAGDIVDDLEHLPAGTYTVTYFIDDKEVFSEDVTVVAGETATSTYRAKSFEDADPYIIRVNLPAIKKDLVTTYKTVTVK